VNENGEVIGVVEAVENFGAGDLLDIKPPQGQNFFLSYDDNTVLSVEDRVRVRIPEVI
jgi:ribosomal 30S subunit maturation factor RimM